MLRIVLAVSLFVIGISPSFAQERVVPETQQQVVLSYAPLVKKVVPAVVNIYTQKRVQQRTISLFNDPFFQNFFGGAMPQGRMRERMESSLGSGVIVKPTGVVVTSQHVVDGADEIKIVLSDKREFDAEIISSDKQSDLAVLKIKEKGGQFPFLEIENSDNLEVGDMVLAIGNPFGVGQTVTSGIVSAVARTNLDITDINYFIQTDAAINPGNSGGALVTMEGKLAGINSAIFSRSGGSMGLGFAVPSNMVRAIVGGAMRGEKSLIRPWTGIKGQEVSSAVAKSLGMARPMGLLVNGLHKASPAQKAGVKVGDVITHIDDREIEAPGAFGYRLATLSVGGEVPLTLLRAGKQVQVNLELIAPPEIPRRDETLIEGGSPLAGSVLVNLSPALAEENGWSSFEEGVVVYSVQSGSPAARLGLRKGDMLIKVGDESVENVNDANRLLLQEKRRWNLILKRDGEVMRVMVGR